MVGPDLIILDYQDTILARRIQETRIEEDTLKRMSAFYDELREIAMRTSCAFLFQHHR